MFLFNPEAPRPNLAEVLREEAHFEEQMRLMTSTLGYTKKVNKSNRVKVVDGIPYQAAGGGRRRLSTVSNY